MNEDLIRVQVATCVRMLEYLGLIDFSGHVSYRIPGTDRMFINAWGGAASPPLPPWAPSPILPR